MPKVQVFEFDPGILAERVNESGLTATQVAARAGCCSETVRSAMRGKAVGIVTARAISRVLGRSLESLKLTNEKAAATCAA